MNLVAATAALVAGIFVWWLAARRLTTRSWEAQGTHDGRDVVPQAPGAEAMRTGLWVFLGVATSFFGLLLTAYVMRMSPYLVQGIDLRDWRPVAEPAILWLNTALLALGSLGMQVSVTALRRSRFRRAAHGLLAGGAFGFAFLLGQALAWRQLQAAGVYASANPANAFFYVLTALHALHLLGGLAAWTRAVARLSRGGVTVSGLRPVLELCALYWHYLLAVWLVLFGLLSFT